MIAQEDRVGERAEGERVLRESRHGQRPRPPAERDDEALVADGEQAGLRLDADRTGFGVVLAARPAEQELRVRAHLPQRHHDVTRLDRPRGRLGQHRREEHEVVEVDDRRASAAQQPGHPRAGEPAPEDQRSAARLPLLHRRSLSLRP